MNYLTHNKQHFFHKLKLSLGKKNHEVFIRQKKTTPFSNIWI